MGATAGGAPCRPPGEEVVSGDSRVQRWELNDETWVATAWVKGDLVRDFVSVQAAELVSGEDGYSQTRRYQRIGECPEGWNVGDTTDQQGNHVKGRSALLALVGG